MGGRLINHDFDVFPAKIHRRRMISRDVERPGQSKTQTIFDVARSPRQKFPAIATFDDLPAARDFIDACEQTMLKKRSGTLVDQFDRSFQIKVYDLQIDDEPDRLVDGSYRVRCVWTIRVDWAEDNDGAS